MFDYEMENRKQFFYPPFSRIIHITLKHKNKDVVNEAAIKLGGWLGKDLGNDVIGPSAPVVNRIRNQYLMELLIKVPLDSKKMLHYKKAIRNYFNLLLSETRFKSVTMVADVDAV